MQTIFHLLAFGPLGSCLIHGGLFWVHKAFWIPTCWYNVNETNVKPQPDWDGVLVEYRL